MRLVTLRRFGKGIVREDNGFTIGMTGILEGLVDATCVLK